MTVKASSESTDCEQQVPSESKKEDLSVGQLLLEFKMQQMVEQKMRMKLAKKIRLCRKLLVRKRKKRKYRVLEHGLSMVSHLVASVLVQSWLELLMPFWLFGSNFFKEYRYISLAFSVLLRQP
ncbi:hypothetical protein V6N13_048991 [Hibiscus sabdariffa]